MDCGDFGGKNDELKLSFSLNGYLLKTNLEFAKPGQNKKGSIITLLISFFTRNCRNLSYANISYIVTSEERCKKWSYNNTAIIAKNVI